MISINLKSHKKISDRKGCAVNTIKTSVHPLNDWYFLPINAPNDKIKNVQNRINI